MEDIVIEICNNFPGPPDSSNLCHSPSDALFSPNSKRLLRRKILTGATSPSDGVMSPCSRKIFGGKNRI